MRSFLTVALVAAPLFMLSKAEGINCEGGAGCSFSSGGVAGALNNLIQGIDPNRWYDNQEQIACVGSDAQTIDQASGEIPFCAFLQSTGGAWGSTIAILSQAIVDHGCNNCGSVPYYFPQGDNNVSDGELTFNEATNPDCGEPALC